MISNRRLVIAAAAFLRIAVGLLHGQNPLFIPDTLAGPNIQLTVAAGTRNYFPGFTTPTYGYNGNILGPTLLLQTGDSVTLHVTNNLNTGTTVHWHGFHVAPEHDGGPHQVIAAGATWSPSFRMRNRASTLWYHPHGEGKTELQVTRGLAGLVIVRDAQEATYDLPRRYGVDDFPVILQTKAIDVLGQFAIATHEDSILLVNGTLDPVLDVPQQVARFRVLNGSTDRTYLLGLSDNATFHLIASDGGLLAAPIATNRVRISPGERAEILVSFQGYTLGQQLDLLSYSSELPSGIIGADSVGTATNPIGEGYYSNPLNGLDFRILHLTVVAPTTQPITSIPTAFAPLLPIDTIGIDAHRLFHMGADTAGFGEVALVDGPFRINDVAFDMDTINHTTQLGNKEIWTLTNTTMVAHPFHIHDIQFFVLDINGMPPPPQYAGWKDVILVMPHDTVRFVGVFDDFADPTTPYMYHCHLLHHEDDGMMGQFLVLNPGTAAQPSTLHESAMTLFPNPASDHISIDFQGQVTSPSRIEILDAYGRVLTAKVLGPDDRLDLNGLAAGFYFVRVHAREGNRTMKFLKQ